MSDIQYSNADNLMKRAKAAEQRLACIAEILGPKLQRAIAEMEGSTNLQGYESPTAFVTINVDQARELRELLNK